MVDNRSGDSPFQFADEALLPHVDPSPERATQLPSFGQPVSGLFNSEVHYNRPGFVQSFGSVSSTDRDTKQHVPVGNSFSRPSESFTLIGEPIEHEVHLEHQFDDDSPISVTSDPSSPNGSTGSDIEMTSAPLTDQLSSGSAEDHGPPSAP
ncbi:hypothetical protein BJ085DRAFT_36089 [Dimargaris cristalligena]|uniref:Uncharacterized protein n=1 Tax=Dimargaris cristalligena TaxID=215637 RepID=A0A4P9ZZG1_9FUNG|nr:hypothetical protein BJ085DRAFT_36089 [Dimargaris cristalligena]|eukprot:RKP39097.1 hypothetical protein BJ085DRAFT_36089 [Dimargaris cristalligena]